MMAAAGCCLIVVIALVIYRMHLATYGRPPGLTFAEPLGRRFCQKEKEPPRPGFYARCKPGWTRTRIDAIDEDLIVYEARALHATRVSRPTGLLTKAFLSFIQAVITPPVVNKGRPLLRVTALVTNPEKSIFFYGDDHMGVSPTANRIASSFRCRANGKASPATVRYAGHAPPSYWDSSPPHTVRHGDVLMIIECELASFGNQRERFDSSLAAAAAEAATEAAAAAAGESPPPTHATILLEVAPPNHAQARNFLHQQPIPLELCLMDQPKGYHHELALCSSPIYGWSPRAVVEWVEYHRIMGFDHVYIYDRNDAYATPLRTLVREGAVTIIPWSSHCPAKHCRRGVGEYFDQFG